MKCPKCLQVQKRRDGMVCTRCGYTYHFDPQDAAVNPLKMTDTRFRAVVSRATANGTRYVTEDELYAVACRHGVERRLSLGTVLLGLGLLGLVVAAASRSIVWLLVGVLLLLLYMLGIGRRRMLSRQEWDGALAAWRASGRDVDNLITKPALHEPPPEWAEPDIYDYGVERLLICDDRLTVDWLVKNGMHTQERALILSEDGYPSYLVPVAQRALEAQPDLPVFLLHRCDPEARPMAQRVRAQPWWPLEAKQPMTDLGLHPEDIEKLQLPAELQKQPNALAAHALPIGLFATLLPVAFAEGLVLAEAHKRQPAESYG